MPAIYRTLLYLHQFFKYTYPERQRDMARWSLDNLLWCKCS